MSLRSKSNSNLLFSFTGKGFVGVCLEWGVLKNRTFVVNYVYSKCDLMEKRTLWHSLLEVKRGLGEGAWCIIGDFNAVCCSEERKVLKMPAKVQKRITEIQRCWTSDFKYTRGEWIMIFKKWFKKALKKYFN